MIYDFLKTLILLGFRLYLRKKYINGLDKLPQSGPLLLASNHPDGFVDPLILGTSLNRKVYFLARGDIFNNKFAAWILGQMHILPVYRLEEGRSEVSKNEATFQRCVEIFRQGGVIIIYPEGNCINDFYLRPLKNGTARLVMNAWQEAGLRETLKVVPVGMNYNHFYELGRTVVVNIGEAISANEFNWEESEANIARKFTDKLYHRLRKLVNPMDHSAMKHQMGLYYRFYMENSLDNRPGKDFGSFGYLMDRMHEIDHQTKPEFSKKVFDFYETFKTFKNNYNHKARFNTLAFVGLCALIPFMLLGWLLNLPIRQLAYFLAKKTTRFNIFFDSIYVGVAIFSYPVYLLLLSAITYFVTCNGWAWGILLLIPILGWIYLNAWPQFRGYLNFFAHSRKKKAILADLFFPKSR